MPIVPMYLRPSGHAMRCSQEPIRVRHAVRESCLRQQWRCELRRILCEGTTDPSKARLSFDSAAHR